LKSSTHPAFGFLGGILIFVSSSVKAQSISGRIVDENNNPIPYANIFIQEENSGVSSNAGGEYFITIDPGFYNFVVSSMGYKTQKFGIQVPDKPMKMDFQLTSSAIELNEVEVKVKRRDPAYEIIQKVIENKEKSRTTLNSARTQIYLKASEVVDRKKKKEAGPPKEEDPDEKKTGDIDPFEEARKKELARLEQINLVEMQLTLNYLYPDQYKEERTAYKRYGASAGLFIPVFSETDFNFYYNLVHLKGISEVPMISPISRTAIVSYKYKLEQTLKEEGKVVYKIKVSARKAGDATCNGFLFINDSTWNINRLELTLHKGGLKFFDDFTIRQEYKEVEEGLWIPHRQEFDYVTKSGKSTFRGNTVLVYSQFERNYAFPSKFFGNEVAVTTAEAYKKDSAFWNHTRPAPLTEDQYKMIRHRDSVEAVLNSKKYQDSIQAKFNRVTVGEVLYHGVGFRNYENKSSFYISGLLNILDFAVVGGFRLGPHASYFRKFENERWIATRGSINMGIKNNDLQGASSIWALYNPYRLAWGGLSVGRQFQSINSFDAYLNQLSISNYILHDYVEVRHRKELFNGFYIQTDANFADRSSVRGYDATSPLQYIIDEDDPIDFRGYQATITHLNFSYTPFQKFMTEPNRKIVLGSKWPTFHFTHRKGWKDIFGSDVDFDYVEFMVDQKIPLGTLGTSKYTIQFGKFANSKTLPFVDLKRFRQSDRYLMSAPMHSFQLLDTALNTTDWFLEAHYMHHFNGAMINNIPLVKKLKLRTVAGAGFMWIRENNYRHQEVLGGVERIFKVGPRRRLKLGLYGVVSESNFSAPRADWKVSIDLIDTWKRDWSY